MKIKHLSAIALLSAASLLTTSCYGSFSLFNKVTGWTTHATNSRVANEVIFILLSPAYAACLFVDALVINSIEFWTGDNPIAQNVGKTQEIMGKDGRMYAVKTLKNGYEITNPDGSKSRYLHDAKNDSWSLVQNGKKQELFRYNGDGTIQTIVNGHSLRITQDEAGLMQLRLAVDGVDWAMK